MSSDDIKVTDQEAREWAAALSPEHKEELKRQALLKRALELSEPEKAPDFGSLTEGQFRDYCRKFGF